jgi:hypothetical protein
VQVSLIVEGLLFSLEGVVLNFGNLDFDIVSDFDIRISSLFKIHSTIVENVLQISSFYDKQTQFKPISMQNKANTKPIRTQTNPIQTQFLLGYN